MKHQPQMAKDYSKHLSHGYQKMLQLYFLQRNQSFEDCPS